MKICTRTKNFQKICLTVEEGDARGFGVVTVMCAMLMTCVTIGDEKTVVIVTPDVQERTVSACVVQTAGAGPLCVVTAAGIGAVMSTMNAVVILASSPGIALVSGVLGAPVIVPAAKEHVVRFKLQLTLTDTS